MHLSGNRANALAVAAAIEVPVYVARVEVEEVGAAGVRRVLRRRPVVAVRAGRVEVITKAAARRRQEDATTVFAFEDTPVYTILCRPFRSAVVSQLVLLSF